MARTDFPYVLPNMVGLGLFVPPKMGERNQCFFNFLSVTLLIVKVMNAKLPVELRKDFGTS